MKMKDDERRLLGAAQEAGEFVALPDISKDRTDLVLKQWVMNGLADGESGRLTAKGMAAKGAVKPQSVPIPPADVAVCEPCVEIPTAQEIPQDTYIGSPLLDDNELEIPPDEDSDT